ncbi:MAG: hypothetical protein CMA10_07080 [Euryarchaeota archaeon]|nr:hypothetical protein [Euryarchaeota archaeon]|tara:strand:- start:1371 stop:2792 length:1422 start_codon:yes stop_codon:yes gene_type:complete
MATELQVSARKFIPMTQEGRALIPRTEEGMIALKQVRHKDVIYITELKTTVGELQAQKDGLQAEIKVLKSLCKNHGKIEKEMAGQLSSQKLQTQRLEVDLICARDSERVVLEKLNMKNKELQHSIDENNILKEKLKRVEDEQKHAMKQVAKGQRQHHIDQKQLRAAEEALSTQKDINCSQELENNKLLREVEIQKENLSTSETRLSQLLPAEKASAADCWVHNLFTVRLSPLAGSSTEDTSTAIFLSFCYPQSSNQGIRHLDELLKEKNLCLFLCPRDKFKRWKADENGNLPVRDTDSQVSTMGIPPWDLYMLVESLNSVCAYLAPISSVASQIPQFQYSLMKKQYVDRLNHLNTVLDKAFGATTVRCNDVTTTVDSSDKFWRQVSRLWFCIDVMAIAIPRKNAEIIFARSCKSKKKITALVKGIMQSMFIFTLPLGNDQHHSGTNSSEAHDCRRSGNYHDLTHHMPPVHREP